MVAQSASFDIHETIKSLQAVTNHLAVPLHTPPPIIEEEYQSIVDEGLQLAYSQHHRIISRLYPPAVSRISIEQLRQGPLGDDLSRLAQIAAGTMRAGRDEVLGAIDSVLELLFWPVGTETYMVPRSFWVQPLGRMLSLAKLRSFEPGDLMTIGAAADFLNVTRPTIYRWMDDKSLDYVRDDLSGQTFIVRSDVEAMKADMDAYQAMDVEARAAALAEVSPQLRELGQDALASLESLSRFAKDLEEVHGFPDDETIDEVEMEARDALPLVRLRVNEEPLTASTLRTLTSVATTLHTKLWLIHQDRFADLINYAQTRDGRFEREASLRIVSLSYNSPLDIKLNVGIDKVGDALQKGIDAFGQTGLRYKEQRLKNEGIATENRLRDLQAQSALADQEQNRQLAQERAGLEVEKARLEIERERLALQRERLLLEHERVTLAIQTAMHIVETVRPDVTDPTLKATAVQTLVPELLQGGNINGLEIVLPTTIAPEAGKAEVSEAIE